MAAEILMCPSSYYGIEYEINPWMNQQRPSDGRLAVRQWGHFRHPERQGEEALVSRWLSEHGFRLEALADGVFFEGAGDALFCGDTLFAGYRIRSDTGDRLQCRVISLVAEGSSGGSARDRILRKALRLT